MKVLTALCIFLLSGLASCYNKRQSPCSCTNARQAAIATCSIPDSLFPLPEPIPPFGNVLGSIAGRVDGASILNSICTSYSCYSSLEILYSCCMVSDPPVGGVTNSFTELVRNYVCNTPTSTAGFCFSSYSDVGAIMRQCGTDRCSSSCGSTLLRSSCCVISYFELLINTTQQRILTQDIWTNCGLTPPQKCSNPLVII
ncbi:uncharacterized protein [Dysidea avara]|uniref:uncharacterized protein n=1 Tax=Dysidea avara TaxID=196820 RepID=UPI00332C97FE